MGLGVGIRISLGVREDFLSCANLKDKPKLGRKGSPKQRQRGENRTFFQKRERRWGSWNPEDKGKVM